MSAPKTNVERQKRRHIVPLIGIAVVTAFAVLLMVYWLMEEAAESDPQMRDDTVDAPASDIPPDVTTPAPQANPGAQPAPQTPQPVPQDATPDAAPVEQ